jgi:hypothetical protein
MEGACVGLTADKAGTCAPPLADGLDCGSNLECESKACVNRVCKQRMMVGHSCYADSECESEHCDGIARVCVPPSSAMCE